MDEPKKMASKRHPNATSFKPGDPRAGRPKGIPNKVALEVKEASQQLVEDPAYRKKLRARLLRGEVSPPVETMLWHYAYGKPKERVELTGPNGGPIEMTVEQAQKEIEEIEAEAARLLAAKPTNGDAPTD